MREIVCRVVGSPLLYEQQALFHDRNADSFPVKAKDEGVEVKNEHELAVGMLRINYDEVVIGSL